MESLVILLGLLILLFGSIPVGIALAGMGTILLWVQGLPLSGIPQEFFTSVNSFTLLAVPIFLLTSQILLKAGAAKVLFDAVQGWVGGMRGGVAVAAIISCGLFAAISGSSVAVAAMIGTVAIPEMISRGYEKRFVMGTLAAGATLGILIPPSIPLIIYAEVAHVSTADMFLAGVGPGVLMIGLFLIYCVLMSYTGAAPRTERNSITRRERNVSTLKALPVVGIAGVMIVGIYSGIFTPTESAAVGLTLTLLYVLILRKGIALSELNSSVRSAGVTTASLLLIISGANVFGKAITLYRIPYDVSMWITENIQTVAVFIIVVSLVLLILGLFLEGIAMILIVLPVLLPSLQVHGLDPIWFGIYFVIMIELALITPPVWMNLFVIQSVARSNLADVMVGALPFVGLMLIAVVLIYFLPGIVLFLPFMS